MQNGRPKWHEVFVENDLTANTETTVMTTECNASVNVLVRRIQFVGFERHPL